MKQIGLNLKTDKDGSAEVFVEGVICGNKYCFLLDTGSAKSTITTDNYIARFNSLGESTGTGVFATIREQEINIPHIEVGPISKRNFKMYRTEEKENVTKNLIGLDFLKDHSLQICFDSNKVLVDHQVNVDVPLNDLVLGKKYHPYVDVRIGGKKASGVFDTGAGMTVVDLEFIKSNSAHFEEIGTSVGTDSSGTTRETPMFLMYNMAIGKYEFPSHRVVGVDFSHVNASTEIPMDLILGYTTVSKANWFFNFPEKKWRILKLIK